MPPIPNPFPLGEKGNRAGVFPIALVWERGRGERVAMPPIPNPFPTAEGVPSGSPSPWYGSGGGGNKTISEEANHDDTSNKTHYSVQAWRGIL